MQRIAERLAGSGIVLIDMPLTRGEWAAEAAQLQGSRAANRAMKLDIQEQPMPWAEKDMRILLAEADRVRLPVPLSGVVAQAVKQVKLDKGWPTPVSSEDRGGPEWTSSCRRSCGS